jgi:steroid 5-alpha reductase family enzyme
MYDQITTLFQVDHKFLIIALMTFSLSVAGILMTVLTKSTKASLLIGFNTMLPVTAAYLYFGTGDGTRKALILGFVCLYLVRMNVALTAWYANTAASKLGSVLPASAVYIQPVVLTNVFGWLYCLPFNWAADRAGPLGPIDYAAIAVYAVGTVFHFGGDYQKHRFKRRPDSKGKLLTTGFWGLSRHPNYFGDFLVYASFAILAGSPWGLTAPLANLAQYLGNAIPKSERMAARRYGEAWEAYRRRVRCFVPFVA